MTPRGSTMRQATLTLAAAITVIVLGISGAAVVNNGGDSTDTPADVEYTSCSEATVTADAGTEMEVYYLGPPPTWDTITTTFTIPESADTFRVTPGKAGIGGPDGYVLVYVDVNGTEYENPALDKCAAEHHTTETERDTDTPTETETTPETDSDSPTPTAEAEHDTPYGTWTPDTETETKSPTDTPVETPTRTQTPTETPTPSHADSESPTATAEHDHDCTCTCECCS